MRISVPAFHRHQSTWYDPVLEIDQRHFLLWLLLSVLTWALELTLLNRSIALLLLVVVSCRCLIVVLLPTTVIPVPIPTVVLLMLWLLLLLLWVPIVARLCGLVAILALCMRLRLCLTIHIMPRLTVVITTLLLLVLMLRSTSLIVIPTATGVIGTVVVTSATEPRFEQSIVVLDDGRQFAVCIDESLVLADGVAQATCHFRA